MLKSQFIHITVSIIQNNLKSSFTVRRLVFLNPVFMKKLLLLLVFVLVANFSFSQSKVTLKGYVIRPFGEYAVGDTVTIRGTRKNINTGETQYYIRSSFGDYKYYNEKEKNGQLLLLQDVKASILKSYPTTDIKVDRYVVVVNFSNHKFEVCPVFIQSDERYKFHYFK